MASILGLGALLLLLHDSAGITLDQAWKMPKTYELAGVLHLPYIPLSEPVSVFVDGTYNGGSQRISHWGGSTTVISSVNGHSYIIQPEMTKEVCRDVTSCIDKATGEWAPCSAKNATIQGHLEHFLPRSLHLFELSDRRVTIQRCRQYQHEWGRHRRVAQGGAYTQGPRKCGAFYDIKPIEVEEWTFSNTWENLGLGNQSGELYVGYYAIYTDPETHMPLQFRQLGHNVIPSGHPDEYIYDYFYIWEMNRVDPDFFQPPTVGLRCIGQHERSGDELASSPATAIHPGLHDIHMTMPEGQAMRMQKFHEYNQKFKKTHDNARIKVERYHHFHRTRRYIASFNRQKRSYWLELNHMADWSPAERVGLRGLQWTKEGLRDFFAAVNDECQHRCHHRSHTIEVPYEIDWRRRHAIHMTKDAPWDPKSRGYFVTPPKDQGTCGSCWAFGGVGTIEGQIANITHNDRKGKQFPEAVSEQNLMDCSWQMGNKACGGGMDIRGFQWMIEHNHGRIATERTYPYVNENSWCHYDEKLRLTKPFQVEGKTFRAKGIGHVVRWGTPAIYECAPHCNPKLNVAHDYHQEDLNTAASIQSLKEMLWKHGPITVSVDASPIDWYYYSGGIYDNKDCSTVEHDHSILAVGYGTTEDGIKYWIIKNSWGAYWGESGYLRIAEKGNVCGVASRPTYVVMKEN